MVSAALKLKDLLLGRKAKTKLDSILKMWVIALLTKVHLVKTMVFPVIVYGCEWVLVVQSCLTFCNHMDWSLPGSSVHGILQARLLEWVAISFSNGCESWTRNKAECWRIDVFQMWCWRKLLRIHWTARISNQSILKEIKPEYSLEGLILKLKLQYFGLLMQRTDLEKTVMLGKIKGRRRRGP